MRTIEFLVEEASMERMLHHLVPRLPPEGVSFNVRTFSGKQDLLRRLPDRPRGYRDWIGYSNTVVVVIVDRDAEDCVELKAKLDDMATSSGLTVASVAASRPGNIINRIAVEELEAWFLGCVEAIRAAYPRVPATLADRSSLRDPDAVRGGTAEALSRVLSQAGYHRGGLRRTGGVDDIAQHMKVSANRSVSFGHFCEGVRFVGMEAS